MSWGPDGPYPLPDGSTWDGVTGREWESHGSSMTYGGFNPEFHLYIKSWVGSAWDGSWQEITGTARKVQSFNTRRGVKDWWLGMMPGTATIELDYTGGGLSFSFHLVQKVQLTVDVPAGEKELFTGFSVSTQKTFNAAGYPVIRLQLVDHVGWSAQQTVGNLTSTTQVTGDRLRALIAAFAAGYEAADIASLATGVGLTQTRTRTAGNFIDLLNIYLRGELGVMWVHGDGTWRFAMRGWWNPLGNPVATIGSLDRGAGGTRNDPALTEAAVKFPASISRFGAKVTYTSFTWTGSGVGPVTVTNVTGGIGTRQWTDTVKLTVNADLMAGVSTLSTVLPNFPVYTGLFDDSATLFIHADVGADTMDYCAVADVTDFVEVALETQADVDGRSWVPGHVMGVSHSFSPSAGWDTTLELNLGLAKADYDPSP